MSTLLRIDDQDKIKDEILEAYKNQYAVYAWGSFGGHIVKADLQFKSIKFNQKRIVLTPTQMSRSYLEDLLGGSGKINIAIPQMSLLFETEYMSYEDDLEIAFPSFNKFYDRRKSERIDPFIPVSVNIKHKGITFKKSCNDIAVGGLSIVLTRNEMRMFSIDEILENVEISFPLKKLQVKLKVAGLVKMNPYQDDKNPYGGSRLSLTFEGNSILVKKEVLRMINGQKKLVCDIDN
ncbi:hypothetical protein BMS_0083 [Halobacteriovorax marinus SJ]|uniref:PilZ domain-containing protein n=1 Tax=Halobacteriovorax marinus (strain ATCC BAA-682 / DSM 15412 / SJ) TaxID=862908 RepID=E1X267_HALMS|nr:PilZ domain-containing protein [Halobacteriovorax marinus]CBW25023.1 hypothetical protein BMS_0083 [Halobacteriovorax marinus SJ]